MEEKRLIDADDLLIAFGNALNNATLKIGYGFMEQVVNEQPTVDPESLRGHAKWVKDKELKFIIVDDKQQPRGTGNLLYPLQGQNFAKRFRQLGLELLPGLRVQDEG